MEETVQRVEATGLRPVFQEPEGPRMGRNFCLLPGSFQIQRFGTTHQPQGDIQQPRENDGDCQGAAGTAPEAVDFWNGTETESEENRTLTIHWGKPDQDRVR
jgi:hypothetical protein